MVKPKVSVSVKKVHKAFGVRKILDNINLDIHQGEIFVIMGPSGCGKSTLLRHMIGTIQPDRGKIYIKDDDLTSMSRDEKQSLRRCFGMCFQSAALLDSLSVEQNVALPLREHTKLNPDIIKKLVQMKLALVGLQGFEDHLPSMLSGGMQKRVGLARAIALDPEIVFYDEPTSGLDPVVSAVVDKLILDLSKKLHLTSVVVTHDMGSVFRIADRIAMLYQGKILEVGTKEEIRKSKNEVVQQFINGRIKGPLDIRKLKIGGQKVRF